MDKKKITMNVVTGKKDRRKSVTATFVNLIHQRDGYIAMKFVESLDMDTPIYTVHENFISTARHCAKFPDLYLDVFIKMRSPMLMINQFIYDNIILPCLSEEEKKENFMDPFLTFNEESYYPYNYDDAILESFLEAYLDANFPEKGGQNCKNEWINRSKSILSRYKDYVRTSYSKKRSNFDKHKDGMRKWQEFSTMMEMSKSKYHKGINYSLHH